MSRGTCLAAALAVSSLAALPAPVVAQNADPKAAFTEALARVSLALDGAFGDEGPTVAAGLTVLDRTRQQWDAMLRTYESGMARDIGGAAPELAARMHLALGSAYLDRQRVGDAAREIGEAVRLDPRRVEAFTALGLIEAQLTHERGKALEDFRRAAGLRPSDPVRQYLLAHQMLATPGQEEAAIGAVEQFVSAQAEAGAEQAPFVRLGLVQEVADVEPFFPPAPYVEAFRLLESGRYEDAVARMEAAAMLDPLVATPASLADTVRAAGAALRDGAPESALERLRAATSAPAEIHRLTGLAYLANDDADRGVAELREAVRLDPAYERPRIDLARALFERARFAEAVTALTQTLAAIPDSGRARYLLGLTYQKQGNYAAAIDAFQRAAAQRPWLGLNSIYQTIGALHRAQQDVDAAIGAFSERVTLVPNDAEAHAELAEMYFRAGRLAAALAEYGVTLLLDPSRADAQVGIAQIRLRDGRFEDAAAAARRAIAIDARQKEARYVLGTALLRLGNAEEGRRELQEYQRLQDEVTALQSKRLELAALRREATVSTASGDHAHAADLLRKALEAEPGDAGLEFDLGLALLRAGQAAEAIAHLRAGAPAGGADVHRYLSEAYAAAGQAEESRRERALYAQARQEALRRAGAGR